MIQRAKIYADPIRYKKFLKDARDSYQKRKLTGSIRLISELTDEEKVVCRESWRRRKANSKASLQSASTRKPVQSQKLTGLKRTRTEKSPRGLLIWALDEKKWKPGKNSI